MFRGSKGIMGIGTLIIFIATILVAAVAAAVLISTSNVLQQRSLLVGQEARKAITDAVDVVSILAGSDPATETFNNFEILVRLSPGSDPLQMRKFNIQYISPNFDSGANLLYSLNQTSYELPVTVTNNSYTEVFDLDGDGVNDHVSLLTDVFGQTEAIYFNLSEYGQTSEYISLGKNISGAGTTNVSLYILEAPIVFNESIYGYVSIIGDTTADDEITTDVNFTVYQIPSECDFDLLPPEDYFCYVVMNGNDDYVLGSGERFKILYRTKDSNALGIGEDFQFIFTSEKGRLSEARARTPDVVTSNKAKVWPLG